MKAKTGETGRNTDLGNAEAFVEWHGRDLRYCAAWSKWLAWDGRRWVTDDTGAAMRCARLDAIEAKLDLPPSRRVQA